jgi:ferritin-like metal-binding protein YciE
MAMTVDRNDPDQYRAGRALVIQSLNEAHATEKALVTTLQAHITMTPHGAYRTLLDRHLAETRRHARAIEERLDELGAGASVVSLSIGLVQTVVGQVLALSKGPLDLLRGGSAEEKLLKNAKDECATEALEIASYDALEALARALGDGETARLAARHRAEEERMLADLRRTLPALTHATVVARAGGEPAFPAPEGGGDMRPLRPDDELPIPGYDRLNAGQVVSRLSDLSQAQLREVADHERGHRNRRSVLERIAALEAPEPLAGYDELSGAEVIARLPAASGETVARVRDYESRHRRRVAVLEAAQRELSRSG